MFVIVSAVLVALALALGAGGGGGGAPNPANSLSAPSGGVVPENPTNSAFVVTSDEANVYRTTEYLEQAGLEKIHAAESYAALAKNNKTIAGSGVKIAIVDSGAQANHQDVAANLSATQNYNYYNNSTNFGDNLGNGTYAASIAAAAKNGNGIHGVAYDAKLVIADIFNDTNSDLTPNLGIAGAAAIDGVKIINLGWKYGSYTTYNGTPSGTNATDRAVIAALDIAKANDVLVVAATGNDADNASDGGGDSSYLARQKPAKPALFANNNNFTGFVLAVGGVDNEGKIIDASNICGITKNYCLMAPAANILGASSDVNNLSAVGENGKKYALASSSYAAAAEVSGAAAVIRGAWPHLTAPQTANILLRTATDLGAEGVDEIYGYGLLNLYKAVQAQGSNAYAYGATVATTSYDIRSSSISTDPIFGDAFKHNVAPALANAVFFDDYGRDYKANLAAKISLRAPNYIYNNLAANVGITNYKTNILPIAFGKNNENFGLINLQIKSYNELGAKFSNLDKSREDKALTSQNGFSFVQNFSPKSKVGFAFNVDETKNLFDKNFSNFGAISIANFAASPYQSFVLGVYNFNQQNLETKNFNQFFVQNNFFNNKLRFNFLHQTSYQGSSLLASNGLLQNNISDLSMQYLPNKKTNLALSFGNLNEFNNNVLNSQNLGAFESSGNVKTSYFKIALNKKIYKNLSLLANYSQGITKINGNEIGIFRHYQNVKSKSAAIGLIVDNFFAANVGFLYSEPLRVYSGSVLLDVPIARDNDGNLLRYSQNISLKPSGKEQNFEFFYAKNLNNIAQVGFNFLVTKDLGNVKSENKAYLSALNYKLKF